jgi:hypothetical protein
VSKFLLNLLVEILKVLPYSEIYLNSKIKTLFISPPFINPVGLDRCVGPLLPGLPPPFTRPSRPINPWRISGNTFSSLIRAFHPRRLLSLPSLTHGPHLSALSPTPCRPTLGMPPLNLAATDFPVPPSSVPRVAAFAH